MLVLFPEQAAFSWCCVILSVELWVFMCNVEMGGAGHGLKRL